MEKVPFEIIEIRASLSMNGYGLDIFLKADAQIKMNFHDSDQYYRAKKAGDNLSLLKLIFREQINNVIKNNPEHYYKYSMCEEFNELWNNLITSEESDSPFIYNDAMELLRACAAEKDIEFDGYFNQRLQDAADTIINFDKDYFEDADRRNLYVFLSAMVDEEIFQNLKTVYAHLDKSKLTRQSLKGEIEFLTKEKGISF